MKKNILFKIILCVSLSAMCLFTTIGYAAITGNLQISGTAEWEEPHYISITNISVSERSNVTPNTASASKVGLLAFQYDNATLSKQGNGASSPGGYITLEVTVRNNTRVDQYFMKYIKDWSGGTVTLTGISAGTKIISRSSLTFYIKIQNTSRNSTLSLTGKEILLEFSPQFTADDTANATKNVAEIFQNVLDNMGPDGQGSPITVGGKQIAANKILSELLNKMDEGGDGGGYMGNVGNADNDQKELINAIFGDATIMIGNQSYSVLMLIKEQKVDNGDTWDIVLYVTADQLTIGGGKWQNNAYRDLNYVPVYCIVYINTGTNNKPVYEYCDHLFAGQAPVCDMSGKFGANNVGNLHTGLWDSTDYPTLTDKSNGTINNQNITVDGELNEAYAQYKKDNP